MKTVVLQVVSGPEANRRIWVRLGQVVNLGSADHADVVIQSDPSLAPIHCTIGHSRAGCFVECLDDQGRMSVNGRPIERIRLHNGDVMTVGNTQLKAAIEENRPADKGDQDGITQNKTVRQRQAGSGTVNTPAPAATGAVPADSEPTDRSEQDAGRSYRAYQLSQVVWQIEAESNDAFPLSDAITLFATNYSCFVCVDCQAIDLSQLRYGDRAKQLGNSLVCTKVTQRELIELLGQPNIGDRAIGIFSDDDLDLICANMSGQLFSFHRPNIFATQISVATPGVARKLMGNNAAVLVVDNAHGWCAFTTKSIDQACKAFGLPAPPQQPSTS